jgi:hypothetical protein
LYCKYCDEEIVFDDDYVSEYSGKKIPLDAETYEPHIVHKKRMTNMNKDNKHSCHNVSSQTSFSIVVTDYR